MKTYTVTIPIAGHCVVSVEAENKADAIEKAFNDVTVDDLEEWEALAQFNQGNVCYCPKPWEVEAFADDGDDDEDEDDAA